MGDTAPADGKGKQRNANPIQDAERRRAGLGSSNDRQTLGDDAERDDDRIRAAGGGCDESAAGQYVRAERDETAGNKIEKFGIGSFIQASSERRPPV